MQELDKNLCACDILCIKLHSFDVIFRCLLVEENMFCFKGTYHLERHLETGNILTYVM